MCTGVLVDEPGVIDWHVVAERKINRKACRGILELDDGHPGSRYCLNLEL